MRARVARWGNSAAVRLPKAMVEEMNLKPGQEVDIVVKPILRLPRITLEDMIAEMDRLGPENEPPFEDWGLDVGAEIIDDQYSRGDLNPPGGRHRVG